MPVCPACRSPLSLDAHVCARCRLAVRPTCSTCGEALEARMHACPRCWEIIEQPPHLSEGTMVPIQTAPEPELPRFEEVYREPAPVAAPTLTREIPTVSSQPQVVYVEAPAPAPRKGGRRVLRALLIGLLSGLLAAAGLLVLETFGPRLRGTLPEQVKLERQDFSEGDFAIGIPAGWSVHTDREDGQPVVTASEPSDDGTRSFQVAVDRTPFAKARESADKRLDTAGDYHPIDVVDGLNLDGRRAFRHIYTDGDDYHERWWIERGDGTYRLDFSSPVAQREEAAQLNVRIARTFDVL